VRSGSRRARMAAATAGVLPFLLAVPGPARAQLLQSDSNLPIEITADSLEVMQKENIATFTGNVDAVQGDTVLSADKLRVHYKNDQQGGSTSPASGGAIQRIEAEGHVFLSSPRETAQGNVGVYDVAGNQLTMQGAVVLTRDDNVIRGERLEIDLVSGRSRVLAAVPSSEGGKAPQRVRAIFVPQSKEPAAGPAAGASARTAADGGGSAAPGRPATKPAATE
jgi:lipopolysaccharide export system protein LptA